MELHHFFNGFDATGELAQPTFRMLVGFHHDKDSDAQAQFFAGQQGHTLSDDAALFQPLNAPPARIGMPSS